MAALEYLFQYNEAEEFISENIKSRIPTKDKSSFDKQEDNLEDVDYNTYPSWQPSKELGINKEDIQEFFFRIADVFGFQYDNMRNIYDFLMRLLDLRASRLGCEHALTSIHADYIAGVNSNFRKWYFATMLNFDDGDFSKDSRSRSSDNFSRKRTTQEYSESEREWVMTMKDLPPNDKIEQIALYLLCWGEANNIRFIPEGLCFIYKCCQDYYFLVKTELNFQPLNLNFLENAITPIYKFYEQQCIDSKGNDHSSYIGYDDINQLFWHSDGLRRLVILDKSRLLSKHPHQRYLYLNEVKWTKAFRKTFREKRTWLHIILNFNRVWVLHASLFWIYTLTSAPSIIDYMLNVKSALPIQLTITSLSGVIAVCICIAALCLEGFFVPRSSPGMSPILPRIIFLLVLLLLNVCPTIYIFGSTKENNGFMFPISVAQFIICLITVVYLAVVPLSYLVPPLFGHNKFHISSVKAFAADISTLNTSKKVRSYGFWLFIFLSKSIESYFFMMMPLKDSIDEISSFRLRNCIGDSLIGNSLCFKQPAILLLLIVFSNYILFLLDTFLWYVIWNTIFSLTISFANGFFILSPWRKIFSKLPKRIHDNIIACPPNSCDTKFLVSQVWNFIIICMYREHLLSLEHVTRLLYQQVNLGEDRQDIIKEPDFFLSPGDQSIKPTIFSKHEEAHRRILFFAQSLSLKMKAITLVDAMPSFAVLVPHYSEKIFLSLREIVRQENESNISLLDYLKKLNPLEWQCFVKDTKMIDEQIEGLGKKAVEYDERFKDTTFSALGFGVASPEYILRTRIWASLRTQTLFRTISGFMNYLRAIKLFYDIEHSKKSNVYSNLEKATLMSLRKFCFVVSMQKLKHFSAEEKEDVDFLLKAFPGLKIAYLDEENDEQTHRKYYYSALIDNGCSYLKSGVRKPKYKIKLSGNPILGDGKSDNQNHALIFCKGEYIQLIDANQDNFIEESLKIRNVLSEFEEIEIPSDPYSSDRVDSNYAHPVAFVGAREYIFSENTGFLGDIAAGKEQVFGTAFSRTLSSLGGRLHYGHPDFLNMIFMTTRGGVSKAQKSLHLNEDIFAGMNAVLRGGRIKYSEHMQCGKGRDIGFGSILNFTTKIGSGMGEQIISREYYYLCSHLPFDRFLTFYYAHPGFHLNNVMIMLAVKLFLLVGVNLAAMNNENFVCRMDASVQSERSSRCLDLYVLLKWFERSILSIFLIGYISLLPLLAHELTERGFLKALERIFKHFLSNSLLLEIFVCRIYAESFIENITFGGAKYIATGRGFATKRENFYVLYSKFADKSLYNGFLSLLCLVFICLVFWRLSFIYFGAIVIALIFCPFYYNPNQFNWRSFLNDYGTYLQWLSLERMPCFAPSNSNQILVRKSPPKSYNTEQDTDKKKHTFGCTLGNIINLIRASQLVEIIFIACGYFFVNSYPIEVANHPNILLRLCIIILLPIVFDVLILLVAFFFSSLVGLRTAYSKRYKRSAALVAYSFAFLNHLFFLEVFCFFQNWEPGNLILGISLIVLLLRFVLVTTNDCLINRDEKVRLMWWSGVRGIPAIGWRHILHFFKELGYQVFELNHFLVDITLGHLILILQIPMLLIPYVNFWHNLLLFWFNPRFNYSLSPKSLKKERTAKKFRSLSFFLLILVLFLGFFIPFFLKEKITSRLDKILPETLLCLKQSKMT